MITATTLGTGEGATTAAVPVLRSVYDALFRRIGPQQWWPADTRFEVMIGAVLVQQTRWENAARSIARLSAHGLLDPAALASADTGLVRECLVPSGFMTAKVRAVTALARWVVEMPSRETDLSGVGDAELRAQLLTRHGVGPETADAMLLYAFDRPVFVADTYARRLFEALGIDAPAGYEGLRRVGMGLCHDARFTVEEYQELHALVDEFGKLVRAGQENYDVLLDNVAGMRGGVGP